MSAKLVAVSEARSSGSPEESRMIGAALGRLLLGGETVVLIGPFGAGKTVFAQGIADGLRVNDRLTSPSFALANSYRSDFDNRPGIHHLDLYRVTSVEEAMAFGLEEYFEDTAVTLIEWPGELEGVLGDEVIRVEIDVQEADNRGIAISFPAGLDHLAESFLSSVESMK